MWIPSIRTASWNRLSRRDGRPLHSVARPLDPGRPAGPPPEHPAPDVQQSDPYPTLSTDSVVDSCVMDTAATQDQDRIPTQFRGLARAFRSKVLANAEAVTADMKAISKAAGTNFARKYAGMRPDRALDATAARWRALPTDGSLSLSIDRKPGVLDIVDVRMTGSHVLYIPEYGEVDELSLVVMIVSLTIGPKKCYWSTVPIASISLHALGRWMQRSAKTDDQSLMRDLQVLALAAVNLRDQPGDFSVPAGDGQWTGMVGGLQEPDGKLSPAVHVRTFLP
jgi:hypothetical protein